VLYADLQRICNDITKKNDNNLCFKNEKNFFAYNNAEISQREKNINIIANDAVMQCIDNKDYVSLARIYLKISEIILSYGTSSSSYVFTDAKGNPITNVYSVVLGTQIVVKHGSQIMSIGSINTALTRSLVSLNPVTFEEDLINPKILTQYHPTYSPSEMTQMNRSNRSTSKDYNVTDEYKKFYNLMVYLHTKIATYDQNALSMPAELFGPVAIYLYNSEVLALGRGIAKVNVDSIHIDNTSILNKNTHPSQYGGTPSPADQQIYNRNMDITQRYAACDP
jgi:hypothetical protein